MIIKDPARLGRLARATVSESRQKKITIRITYFDPEARPTSRYEIRDGACAKMPCSSKELGPR